MIKTEIPGTLRFMLSLFSIAWGNVSHIIEYVIDITARKQAEEGLKWELSVNSALSRLYKPLTASPMASIKTIKGIFLEQAKILSGSEHGFIYEIDCTIGDDALYALSETAMGRCRSVDDIRKRNSRKKKEGIRHCQGWESLNTSKAFYNNSPTGIEEFKKIYTGDLPIKRFLSAPVLLGEELVGHIFLVNKDSDYTEHELEAVSRLSALYALAVQRKRTEDKLRAAHEELERRIEERTVELEKSCDEKTVMREIFGTYISNEVVTKILQSPGGPRLGGEAREVTVLVSDLRNFSAIIEALEAPEVVKIINRYLEKMVPIILDHEGTIDEFTGDGILVFFGAPRKIPDQHSRAVACALDMQNAVEQLNREHQSLGLPQLGMGIGISSGRLIVGNIGSEKRKKYGAVGTPIIAAFRLEKKARPGEVLITETVKSRIKDSVEVGNHWKDYLKGIGDTILYQVNGKKQ